MSGPIRISDSPVKPERIRQLFLAWAADNHKKIKHIASLRYTLQHWAQADLGSYVESRLNDEYNLSGVAYPGIDNQSDCRSCENLMLSHHGRWPSWHELEMKCKLLDETWEQFSEAVTSDGKRITETRCRNPTAHVWIIGLYLTSEKLDILEGFGDWTVDDVNGIGILSRCFINPAFEP